jgi:hypothetical protein
VVTGCIYPGPHGPMSPEHYRPRGLGRFLGGRLDEGTHFNAGQCHQVFNRIASHPVDQVANLGVKLRATHPVRGGPLAPIELEALAMPGEDGGGLHDDETRAPSRPPAGEPGPEDPVPT